MVLGVGGGLWSSTGRSEFANIGLKAIGRGLKKGGMETVRCLADLINTPGSLHLVDTKEV